MTHLNTLKLLFQRATLNHLCLFKKNETDNDFRRRGEKKPKAEVRGEESSSTIRRVDQTIFRHLFMQMIGRTSAKCEIQARKAITDDRKLQNALCCCVLVKFIHRYCKDIYKISASFILLYNESFKEREKETEQIIEL